MKPHSSALERPVRWTNYRTGVRDLYIRCDIDNKHALLAIDLQHRDADIRALFWDQWLVYKSYLHAVTKTEWQWDERFTLADGRQISRIWIHVADVSLFQKQTWPDALSFLKTHMLRLDECWADIQPVFLELDS